MGRNDYGLEKFITGGLKVGIAIYKDVNKANKKRSKKWVKSSPQYQFNQERELNEKAAGGEQSFSIIIFLFLILSIIGLTISFNLFANSWNFLGVIFSIATLLCIGIFIFSVYLESKKLPHLTTNELVTDIDGNVYSTVTIGTQVWMIENLKTTKYRNGDLIGTTIPATLDIRDENTPKYQWAYAGNESNVSIYGRLYTLYAIEDSRNICPHGWHVPNNTEWELLHATLGAIKIDKMEYRHTSKIEDKGFTLPSGGNRYFDGSFNNICVTGHYWSSSEDPDSEDVHYGNSVRCIKDKPA